MSFYPLALLESSGRVVALDRKYRQLSTAHHLGWETTINEVIEAREAWLSESLRYVKMSAENHDRETKPPAPKPPDPRPGDKSTMVYALVDIRESLDKINRILPGYNLRGGLVDEIARLGVILDSVEREIPILMVLRNAQSLTESPPDDRR